MGPTTVGRDKGAMMGRMMGRWLAAMAFLLAVVPAPADATCNALGDVLNLGNPDPHDEGWQACVDPNWAKLTKACTNATACTATPASTWDLSAAGSTAPCAKGASLPATCTADKQCFVKTTDHLLYWCTATDTWTTVGSSGGGGYGMVEDEGASLSQRATIDFIGAGVSCVDNSSPARTECTISGASGTWSVSPAGFGTNIAAAGAADRVTGMQFYPLSVQTILGVKFYWLGATHGAQTVRCRLWNNTTSVANVDVSAPASNGLQTCTFGSAYTVASTDVNKNFSVSVYTTTANVYTFVTTGNWPGLGTASFSLSPAVVVKSVASCATGDVFPTANNCSERYPVEPVFQ